MKTSQQQQERWSAIVVGTRPNFEDERKGIHYICEICQQSPIYKNKCGRDVRVKVAIMGLNKMHVTYHDFCPSVHSATASLLQLFLPAELYVFSLSTM